jgi:hypothetical protein
MQLELKSSILRPNQKDGGGDTTLIFFLSFPSGADGSLHTLLNTSHTSSHKLCPKLNCPQFEK